MVPQDSEPQTACHWEGITMNYTLNEERCVSKKLSACRRENYTIERKEKCANVVFNAASYEMFRRAAVRYYNNNQDYEIVGKPLKDKASNIAAEVVQIHFRQIRNTPKAYTLNLYNTKSSVMVNGQHFEVFVDDDLPVITELIDQLDDNIKEMNAEIEQSLLRKQVMPTMGQEDVYSGELRGKALEAPSEIRNPQKSSSPGRYEDDERFEENMNLAMKISLEMSKRTIIKCQLCDQVMNDNDELALHNLECTEIGHNGGYVNRADIELVEVVTSNPDIGGRDGEQQVNENMGKVCSAEVSGAGDETEENKKDQTISWQTLEEKEQNEINTKLIARSPRESRSKRNRPPSWKVRDNLDNEESKVNARNMKEDDETARKIKEIRSSARISAAAKQSEEVPVKKQAGTKTEKRALEKLNLKDESKMAKSKGNESTESSRNKERGGTKERSSKGKGAKIDEKDASSTHSVGDIDENRNQQQELHDEEIGVKRKKVENAEEGKEIIERTRSRKDRDATKSEEQNNTNRDNGPNDDESSSESEDEIEKLREQLEKKDTIINDQLVKIQESQKEIRALRVDGRGKDNKLDKLTKILIDKEDKITRLTDTMSNLGTRDLMKIKQKIVEKASQSTQTDPIERNTMDLGIRDKLPAFEKKGIPPPVFEKKEDAFVKRNAQLLNINVTRGVADKCFKCWDLEKKIKKQERTNDQLRKQIKEYQIKLGNIRQIGKETLEEIQEEPDTSGNQEGRLKDNNQAIGETEQVGTEKQEEKGTNITENESKVIMAGTGRTELNQLQMKEKAEDKEERNTSGDEMVDNTEHVSENLDESSSNEGRNYGRDETKEIMSEESAGEVEEHIRCSSGEERERDKKKVKFEKDYSKLCNRYVWDGECVYKDKCYYTHKNICRQLREQGECTSENCEEGHNVDGVCKRFNQGRCSQRSSYCKYLHIRLKEKGSERPKPEKEVEVAQNEKNDGEKVDASNIAKDGERSVMDKVLDGLAKIEREGWVVDVIYSDDDGEERNESTSRMLDDEQSGEESWPSHDQSSTENMRTALPERDLTDFLWLSMKHNVWKEQIVATKAEIKKLEEEIKATPRKRLKDRNQ